MYSSVMMTTIAILLRHVAEGDGGWKSIYNSLDSLFSTLSIRTCVIKTVG